MRQIGSVDNGANAKRFSDYLLVQGIENVVESEPGGKWSVWIKGEEDLARAGTLLQSFSANPAAEQFNGSTEAAAKLLMSHDWPGNVRELRNAIERAMILEEGASITAASLPIAISRPDGTMPAGNAIGMAIPADGLSLEDNERSLLVRALEKTDGNQTQAARLLRITRDTLRYKMKKFNLR